MWGSAVRHPSFSNHYISYREAVEQRAHSANIIVLRTKQLKIDSGRRPTISRMEPLLSAKAAHFSVSSLPNLSPLEVGFC
jgi:hypothetical protein